MIVYDVVQPNFLPSRYRGHRLRARFRMPFSFLVSLFSSCPLFSGFLLVEVPGPYLRLVFPPGCTETYRVAESEALASKNSKWSDGGDRPARFFSEIWLQLDTHFYYIRLAL